MASSSSRGSLGAGSTRSTNDDLHPHHEPSPNPISNPDPNLDQAEVKEVMQLAVQLGDGAVDATRDGPSAVDATSPVPVQDLTRTRTLTLTLILTLT